MTTERQCREAAQELRDEVEKAGIPIPEARQRLAAVQAMEREAMPAEDRESLDTEHRIEMEVFQ